MRQVVQNIRTGPRSLFNVDRQIDLSALNVADVVFSEALLHFLPLTVEILVASARLEVLDLLHRSVADLRLLLRNLKLSLCQDHSLFPNQAI